jgi:hypothetical protein
MGSTAYTPQQASGHAKRRHGPSLRLTGIILKSMSISELTIVKEIKTLDAFNSRPQGRFPGAGICGVITTIDAHPGDTPLENSGRSPNAREQPANWWYGAPILA